MALRLTPCVAALCSAGLWLQPVSAQQIVPDGRTATTLSTHSNVTDVMTATQRGANAFNAFVRFDVHAGNIANLHVPNTARNLINIVSGSASNIHGVLNAVKNGQIGGNVWFANPHGMVVGSSGIINVGSLHVSAPTPGFVDNFFTAPGMPDDGSVARLLDGTAPRNADATITIDGTVNAVDTVSVSAGAVNVGGAIYSGARFVGTAPRFDDVVNANGMAAATRVVERGGKIFIVADGDVAVHGVLNADGAAGVRAGDIAVRADGDLRLQPGARISASGSGASSDGGTVDLWAERSAVAQDGALVDASAGSSGKGGNVEFSAKDTVELAGGEFRADGRGGGAAGRVLIDPANIVVSANILRTDPGYGSLPDGGSSAGADLTLLANEAITVNENVVVSSRMVGSDQVAVHVAGDSTGDSGAITFAAPSITLKSGSQVLAHGNAGHAGGAVTLNAASQPVVSILGYRAANASIQVGDDNGGATIRGATVDLKASTAISTKWAYETSDGGSYIDDPTDVDTAGRTLALGASTAAEAAVGLLATLVGVNIVHSQAVASSSVVVKSGSTIASTGTVSLKADNTTTAGAAPTTPVSGPGTKVDTPLGLGALYARNKSTATVTVENNATIKGTDLDVRAHNTASLEAEIASADAGSDSGDIAIALGVTNADIQAKAVVAQGARIHVTGRVSVAATNVNSFTTSVEAQTGAGGKASAAIAVSEISTQATAELRADVRDAQSIQVVAINDNQKNATTANSKAGQSLNDMIVAGVKEKLEPLTDPSGALENFLWDKLLAGEEPDTKVQPKSTPFRIGGAIAHATSSADATALVGNDAALHATDSIAVVARTKATDLQISAEASAVSQSRERAAADTARTTFSAGVAIGNYRHDALAKVGANAVLTAQRVGVAADVMIPVRESILTGGSFDRWSGLSTIGSWLESLTNAFDIFNGSSSASSTSDNSNGSIALSGSVNLLTYTHTARAVMDTGARIQLPGAATGAWSTSFELVPDDADTDDADEQVLHDWALAAPAHVRADRDVTLLFHGGKFLPSDGGASKSLGLSYTQSMLTGVTEAILREGATIQGVDETASAADADGLRTWSVGSARATGEAQVTAQASDLLISIAASGGYGGSFGLNGAASIVGIHNSTRALVDDEAVLKAEKISLLAKDTPVSWSIAGGFNKSSSSGVGVGIGYNSVTTNTYAEIADNDAYQAELALARASQIAAAGSILVRDLAVEARSGGRIETIAVTAAVSSDSDNQSSGGFFSNIKNKYESIQGKLGGLVGVEPKSVARTSGSSQGTGQDPKSTFGLSGAGSGAVNDAELNTFARVEGATITQFTGAGDNTLLVRGVSDMDVVTASGAAALTRANKSSQTGSAAITGSVAVNIIDNATQSILRDSTVLQANDVTVQALQGGEQLSIAIGLAIDASNQQSKTKSVSFTGSLSLSFVENDVIAQMDGVTLTGQAGVMGRDVDVVAYNRSFIGTGGGSLSAGGSKAAGGAVTYSDIANTVNASITGGSQLTVIDTVGVAAYNATEIGAGAAHATVSTGSNSNALGGAVVITEITNHTGAAISGLSTVAAFGRVEVLAKDKGADVALEDIIEPGSKRENTVKGLDYCGGSTGVVATPSGNCITSVAGIVQVTPGGGSNNVGLSFNWSQIDNNLTATVEDAAVVADTLAVQAESNATITGLAIGVGVADKTSAVGSVTVNKIDNRIEAAVRAPSNNVAFNSVTAATVDISAKDKSRIDTLAGQVAVSMNGAAVGASVVYAEIGNEALARVEKLNLHAADSAMLTSENDARIRSLAVAGSVVAAGSAPAVSASISVNFIGNTTESTVTDSGIDDTAGTNAVTVQATDKSEIQSLAGSVSVSGTSAAGGGAFAYNKIGNAVTAALDNSTVTNAAQLAVAATQTSKIQNITAAVGGGQTVAISGSVSLNHIGKYGSSGDPDEDGNVTTARIANSAVTNGATMASVKAKDTSSIESLAGAVSISIGSAAVGAAVADNAIRNVAKARVTDAPMAGASGLVVEATNGSTIDSLSVAGSAAGTGAFAGSASSNRVENRTVAELGASALTGSSANVRIAALDTAAIRSLAGAVGIAGTAGVGAAVAVNRIDNTTDAHVTGMRAMTAGYAVSDLIVIGDSRASIQTLAAGVGGGASVGVAGSTAINLIGSDTRAYIDNGAKVQASGSVAVVAESDDIIAVAAGAAGIGASAAGVAASTAVNTISGTTEAYVSGAATEVNARAQTGAGFSVDTGVLDSEVDLAGVVGGTTTSIDVAGMRQQETVKGLAVNASSTHQVRTTAVNIAAGFYAGVGATANVNVIGGDTRAYIDAARVNGGDNSAAGAAQQVQVRASDHAYANTFIGGVSGGLGGVGAAADVNVFDRNTRASVVGSIVDAKGQAAVEALSTQGVSSLVVGLSGGGVAAVGTGALAKFTSRTEAWSDGSTLRVGALDVLADHDTHMFLSAGAVALGGAAFAGTFAVGLDNSITKAHVDGGSVDAPGQISVKAESDTRLKNIGVSGAGAGGAAVAGMAVVALIGNTTQSYVTGARIGSAATPSGALAVTAKDVVVVDNKAGAAAGGGSAGIGLGAGVTKIANTVSAYVVDTDVDVAGNMVVEALAQRDLYTFAATAGVSAGFSLAGAAGVTIVGSTLSDEAKKELGTDTDSQVNSFATKDRLTGDNIETNDNFSQSDIDGINAAGKTNTSQNLATSSLAPGSLDQRTKAQLSGSASHHVKAGTGIRVAATELDKAAMQVGSVAVGAVALGGSVGFLDITNNVESEVSGGLELSATGGTIEVSAKTGKLDPAETAASVQTLQGSGGVVGLGAAVSKAKVTNNVSSRIGSGTTTGNLGGNITVQATDESDLHAQAVGLNVGLVGAGVTIATAEKTGITEARVGDPGSGASPTQVTLAGDTLQVLASRSGKVSSDATAGAGGIIAGSGADTSAKESGQVNALVGDAVNVSTTNGTVRVAATAVPRTEAEAFGVNIGAGAVGASLANASSSANISAGLGAGTQITAARLDVLATRSVGVAPAASASALGASGGYLIGVNATLATSESSGQTSAVVGDNSRLTISGALVVTALNDTDQRADVTGLAAGIVAAGASEANARSTTGTYALLGDDVNIAGGAASSISVLAKGKDTNIASAVSGSGGVVAGAAASANTITISDTRAAVGDSNCGAASSSCGIVAGAFTLRGEHDSVYNGKVDSTQASVAGASGSSNVHTVASTLNVDTGDNVKVTAGHIDVSALNATHKYWWNRFDDTNTVAVADAAAWNVDSGSGGVFSGPAGSTRANVVHNTTLRLGDNALFHVLLPVAGTGSFTVDASNRIVAFDKVKIDSGGAIALADSSTWLTIDALANVDIGAGTVVTSDSGDIDIGSRTDATIDARSVANAYGLAGLPAGEAFINYTGTNTTTVQDGVLLLATDAAHGAINVAAGRNSAGTAGTIDARSAVNIWNKTAVPINSTPDARTNVAQTATLNLDAGSNTLAAGDIALAADRGAISVAAVGVGKDLYREVAGAILGAIGIKVSLDITGGSAPTPAGQARVNANGTVLSGLLRQSATQIDPVIASTNPDGSVIWQTRYSRVDNLRTAPGTSLAANPLDAGLSNPYILYLDKTMPAPGVLPRPSDLVDETAVAPDSLLQERIRLLQDLFKQYQADPVASNAYQSEIDFLTAKLGPQGVGQNSVQLTERGSAALDSAGNVDRALSTYRDPVTEKVAGQELITGDIAGIVTNDDGTVILSVNNPARQKGAVGVLVDAYGTIKTNNTSINSSLVAMKNAPATPSSDATYVLLTGSLASAENSYQGLRSATMSIGNYEFACSITDCATAPVNPLGGTFTSTLDGDLRTVQGSGYLSDIQNGMRNISLLALGQSGATGSLVSNVTDLATAMTNISNANSSILTSAGSMRQSLTTASGYQEALSTSWQDGATSNNVDTARISNVATRISQNTGLLTQFDVATASSAANVISTNADGVAAAAAAATTSIGTVAAASNTPAPSGTQTLITLPDITVNLGNVDVTAEVLAGTGSLQAPGDGKIWILNNAPASMNIGNLTVDSEGGNVRLNGFQINNDADIRRFNPAYTGPFPTIVSRENGAAGSPEIRIVSSYDPGAYDPDSSIPARKIPAAAPDITLGYQTNATDPAKLISNPYGLVDVKSAAGDIYVDGSINAGSVSILASNGDFVQKYVNGFNSIAGEPSGNAQGGPGVLPPNQGAAPGPGIVANGNVFVSARYLNINGLVQSGIVNYHLDIPIDAALRFKLPDNSIVDKAYVDTVYRQSVDVYFGSAADDAAIGATYDPATPDTLTMTSSAKVRGGNITLFGQIINTANGSTTGTGKLAVLDGFGQVDIRNDSSLKVVLKSIDTGVDPDPANPGRGTVGTIDITDVQYVGRPTFTLDGFNVVVTPDPNLYAIRTLISRDQDAITVQQTGSWRSDGSFCMTCTTTSYAADQNSVSRVESLSPRLGEYNPQAGLRYVFTTGQDSLTTYRWTFKGQSFFGTSSLSLPPSDVSRTLTSGPNVKPGRLLDGGTYLSYVKPTAASGNAHANNLQTDVVMQSGGNNSNVGIAQKEDNYTTSSVYTKIAEWNSCDWWSLCISSKYTSIWDQVSGTTKVVTNSVKADYPIQIEFMGANTAGLTIHSPLATVSLADLAVLNNRYGNTTIDAKEVMAGNAALILTQDLAVTASNGSIGGTGAPLNVLMGGVLTAAAVNGDVVLRQIGGPLQISSVTAGGLVDLTALGDIYGGVGNLVQGQRVALTSSTGTIGGIAGNPLAHLPLNVAPGYTDDRLLQRNFGVMAWAAGDIGIDVVATPTINPQGHLLADTIVSAGGDVRLTAPGRILDNNPDFSIDARVWDQLLGFWDSVGLVAGSTQNTAKAGQAVNALESSRKQDYFQYWQIRETQNAPIVYDANWRYEATSAEVEALTARGQDIDRFESSRTERYWTLNTEINGFDAQVYARSAAAATIRAQNPTWTQAQVSDQVLLQEQQGLLPAVAVPTTYQQSFQYVATQDERTALLGTVNAGAWTTTELALSINPGLLKGVTDTNPVIKKPNVAGRNVTLVAGTSFGTTLPSNDPAAVFIPYDTDGNIGDTAKVALATAEFSDFTFDVTKGGKQGLLVEQRLPFNFDATQGLTVSVRDGGILTNGLTTHVANTDIGNAYLATLGDGIINSLSVDGELRLKTKGSISALDPTQVAIQAGDLILEAANASIGGNAFASPVPLLVDVARRGNPPPADSYGSITARAAGPVNIANVGDLRIGGVYSRAAIVLTSISGSILDAHPDTGLDVLGGSVLLLAPLGSIGDLNGSQALTVGTNTGTPLSGLIEAAAGGSVYLSGNPFNAPVGSSFAFGPVLDGHDAVSAGESIKITAFDPERTTTINGNVIAVGPIEVAVSGKLVFSGGRPITIQDLASPGATSVLTVPAAHLRVTGVGTLINARELLMEDGSSLLADTGTIAITTEDDAVITGIETGNGSASAISITSTQGRILDGGDTRLDIIADTPPSALLTISGALGIGNNPLDVRLLNLLATSGGVVDIAVQDSVHIEAITAADRILFSAGGAITGNTVTATGTGSHADQSVSITSANGGVNLARVSGTTGVSVLGQGDVSLGQVNVGTQLDLAGRTVSATVDGSGVPITGSVTGPGGSLADNIGLVLSNPGSGFAFQDMLTRFGAIDILDGRFAVDNFVVSNFASVTNAQTHLIIDQVNRAIQPSDVQLYTGGAGFNLNLDANHVSTNALTVFRSPLHDVVTPDGSNFSAVEEGYNNLVRAFTLLPSAPQSSAPVASLLINYFGNPVALGGNSQDGTCQATPDLLECAQ